MYLLITRRTAAELKRIFTEGFQLDSKQDKILEFVGQTVVVTTVRRGAKRDYLHGDARPLARHLLTSTFRFQQILHDCGTYQCPIE